MRAAIELMATGERDLESVVQFLVDHSKPAAVRFAEAFQSSVFRLREFPEMGVERGRFRWLLIGTTGYGLIYTYEENVVRIVSVRSARDPRPFA